MIIGYSFWGFLGPGITDTPDGGRSHRRTLVDGLFDRGHRLLLLQPDRDYTEAGHKLGSPYRWDAGLPEIDVLFLEWRWPIPGRNTTRCGTPGHTCDLHRQRQLLDHYQHVGVPIVLWDKDRQLPADDPLRTHPLVRVCEPALRPSADATSLLFPVHDRELDQADPLRLAGRSRDLPLVYAGNQYDRGHAFDRYFAPAAAAHRHLVAGKWTDIGRWPHVSFTGRVPFPEVAALHRRAVTTMLLLPDRYARAGQATQRLFEAVLAGCLPLTPADLPDAGRFAPTDLHVRDGRHAADLIGQLAARRGTSSHAELIAACLARLDVFRASRQLAVLDQVLTATTRCQATT